MHQAVGCGSGDVGRVGLGAEHTAEGGLAVADRVVVGGSAGGDGGRALRQHEQGDGQPLAKGIPGLRRDGTRPGRKPPLTGEAIKQVVDNTLHEKPAAGTHWTSRKMAAACGLSYTSVQRIWKAHELRPHRVKTFKLSNDKQFVEKVRDIIACIWIHRTGRWCSRSMKRARSRRLTAPSLACR
jgi:hypothetical protein